MRSFNRAIIQKYILYFHAFGYPVFTIIFMLGRDFIKIHNRGIHSLMTDWISFGLSISIILSLGISTQCSIYFIRKSYSQISYKSLQIYTVIFFVSALFVYTMYSIKNQRDGKKEPGSLFFIVFNFIYLCFYNLDGTTLMITIEEFRTQNGFPRRRSFFGIGLEKLVYIDLVLILVCAFQLSAIYFAITSQLKEHDKEFYEKFIKEFTSTNAFISLILGCVLSGLNAILLLFGICKKNAKVLKIYLVFKLLAIISLGPPWIYTVHQYTQILKMPIDFRAAIFSLFASIPFMIGTFVVDCFIQSIKDRSNETNIFFWEPPSALSPILRRSRIEKLYKIFIKSENIPKIQVLLDDNESPLGHGNFAEVRKGRVSKNYKFQKAGDLVAVKLIRNGDMTFYYNLDSAEDYIIAVFSEIKVLKALSDGHKHLVQFYGVTRTNDDLGIVLEYCSGGSLEKHLREKKQSSQFPKNIDTQDLSKLHKWAVQIASAVEFLANKNIVHGDLATRNVLIDDNEQAKLTDFGSSLNLYQYQTYARSKQTEFPWRWMAPESLSDLKFSTASDVWSYGVLLWELYTFAEIPWHSLEWSSDFVFSLTAGKILDKPRFATDNIYEGVICKCFSILENDRPKFSEILEFYSSDQNQEFQDQLVYSLWTKTYDFYKNGPYVVLPGN